VSRWGRFQDSDEAAHYEFICRQAGVPIHYCGETFQNDGMMPSAIMKTLKRVTAAEFSRELSEKVTLAMTRMVKDGRFVARIRARIWSSEDVGIEWKDPKAATELGLKKRSQDRPYDHHCRPVGGNQNC